MSAPISPGRHSTIATDAVGIVGLGYVGLPLALALVAAGRTVIGVESDADRLDAIRDGHADLTESDHQRLAAYAQSPAFTLTTEPAALSTVGAVIICVPTPVDPDSVPDLRALDCACAAVAERAVRGQVRP